MPSNKKCIESKKDEYYIHAVLDDSINMVDMHSHGMKQFHLPDMRIRCSPNYVRLMYTIFPYLCDLAVNNRRNFGIGNNTEHVNVDGVVYEIKFYSTEIDISLFDNDVLEVVIIPMSIPNLDMYDGKIQMLED